MTKLTEERLATLRTDTPYAAATDELPESYLGKNFAEPFPDGGCLCCGAAKGYFTWGLAHGVGHCFNCGWPARLYHFVPQGDGKDERIIRLLQYHPDGISLAPSKEEA